MLAHAGKCRQMLANRRQFGASEALHVLQQLLGLAEEVLTHLTDVIDDVDHRICPLR